MIQQPPHTVTIEDLYDLMCRYLIDNGWRREDKDSGWWWKEQAPEGEATTGGALEQQFDLDGLDTRIMRAWEPYEFWNTLTGDTPALPPASVPSPPEPAAEWLRCLDCGWVWDDAHPFAEVCDCFDRLGRRRSEQLSTVQVQTHFANATSSPEQSSPGQAG